MAKGVEKYCVDGIGSASLITSDIDKLNGHINYIMSSLRHKPGVDFRVYKMVEMPVLSRDFTVTRFGVMDEANA